jgi:hypothetical protein
MDEAPATFTLSGIPPNENANRRMGSRFKLARVRKQWRDDATTAALGARRPGHPWDRADLTVIFRYTTKRRRDPLGILEACKPLLDGAVDAGLITDDSTDVIHDVIPEHYVQRRGPYDHGDVTVILTRCRHVRVGDLA